MIRYCREVNGKLTEKGKKLKQYKTYCVASMAVCSIVAVASLVALGIGAFAVACPITAAAGGAGVIVGGCLYKKFSGKKE